VCREPAAGFARSFGVGAATVGRLDGWSFPGSWFRTPAVRLQCAMTARPGPATTPMV
jgi:hypothetical protein